MLGNACDPLWRENNANNNNTTPKNNKIIIPSNKRKNIIEKQFVCSFLKRED